MKIPTDAQMVNAAKEKFIREEGNIEVDDNALVSRGDGNEERGAYVQAWVWIYDDQVDAAIEADL